MKLVDIVVDRAKFDDLQKGCSPLLYQRNDKPARNFFQGVRRCLGEFGNRKNKGRFLVFEGPFPAENHGDFEFSRFGDNFLVSNGSSGLDDRGNTVARGFFDRVREGKEGV